MEQVTTRTGKGAVCAACEAVGQSVENVPRRNKKRAYKKPFFHQPIHSETGLYRLQYLQQFYTGTHPLQATGLLQDSSYNPSPRL